MSPWNKQSKFLKILEAPPGFEPGMEVLQIKRKVYVIDSSCFLVSARPSFYQVFGRFWTQVGPKLGWEVFLGLAAPDRVRA